jgi:hypothetical protein
VSKLLSLLVNKILYATTRQPNFLGSTGLSLIGRLWHFLIPFVHLSRVAISSVLMTRDGTTSGSPYALGIHGIRVLLPGLRVGASRFGVDGINATPREEDKPVNETELDHETFHE